MQENREHNNGRSSSSAAQHQQQQHHHHQQQRLREAGRRRRRPPAACHLSPVKSHGLLTHASAELSHKFITCTLNSLVRSFARSFFFSLVNPNVLCPMSYVLCIDSYHSSFHSLFGVSLRLPKPFRHTRTYPKPKSTRFPHALSHTVPQHKQVV